MDPTRTKLIFRVDRGEVEGTLFVRGGANFVLLREGDEIVVDVEDPAPVVTARTLTKILEVFDE